MAVTCDHCGVESDSTKVCSACKLKRYCSRECQKKAWKTHKAHCKQIQELAKKKKNPGPITNARLHEEFGEEVDVILMCARHTYNWQYAPDEIRIENVGNKDDPLSWCEIHRGEPRLWEINCRMFPLWDTDFQGNPGRGIYRQIAYQLQKTDFYPAIHKYARHWANKAVTSSFYVIKELPGGTIMVDASSREVYLVCGLGNTVFEITLKVPGPKPVIVSTTLLPWRGYVVYDGLMVPGTLALSPEATAQMLKREDAVAMYEQAEKEGKIISRINVPIDKAPDPIKRPEAADAAAAAGVHGADAEILTAKEEAIAKVLRQGVTSGKMPIKKGVHLTFRRYGYTPQENPNKWLVALWMREDELFYAPGQIVMKAHKPKAIELLRYLKTARHPLPDMMMIDTLEIVPKMKKALEGLGIMISYYPPPSAYEKTAGGSW